MSFNENCSEPNLITVAEGIWIAEGACVNFYGFPYPTRCVIIRMASGKLWVWSPIELADGLKQEVDALGQVAFLVSPNKIHHLYLPQWATQYPQAMLCGPQSTISKRSDLSFSIVLTNEVPAIWKDDFDQVWFNGSKFLDEIVFFSSRFTHRHSCGLFGKFHKDISVKTLEALAAGYCPLLGDYRAFWKSSLGIALDDVPAQGDACRPYRCTRMGSSSGDYGTWRMAEGRWPLILGTVAGVDLRCQS